MAVRHGYWYIEKLWAWLNRDELPKRTWDWLPVHAASTATFVSQLYWSYHSPSAISFIISYLEHAVFSDSKEACSASIFSFSNADQSCSAIYSFKLTHSAYLSWQRFGYGEEPSSYCDSIPSQFRCFQSREVQAFAASPSRARYFVRPDPRLRPRQSSAYSTKKNKHWGCSLHLRQAVCIWDRKLLTLPGKQYILQLG